MTAHREPCRRSEPCMRSQDSSAVGTLQRSGALRASAGTDMRVRSWHVRASVDHHSDHHWGPYEIVHQSLPSFHIPLTCADGRLGVNVNPRPTSGGQRVVGPSPAVPTMWSLRTSATARTLGVRAVSAWAATRRWWQPGRPLTASTCARPAAAPDQCQCVESTWRRCR